MNQHVFIAVYNKNFGKIFLSKSGQSIYRTICKKSLQNPILKTNFLPILHAGLLHLFMQNGYLGERARGRVGMYVFTCVLIHTTHYCVVL